MFFPTESGTGSFKNYLVGNKIVGDKNNQTERSGRSYLRIKQLKTKIIKDETDKAETG